MDNLEAAQRHFYDVLCDEVDIQIGSYRIGTMEHGKIRVWFAMEKPTLPEYAPVVGPDFDTRQAAIDWALDKFIGHRPGMDNCPVCNGHCLSQLWAS